MKNNFCNFLQTNYWINKIYLYRLKNPASERLNFAISKGM